MLAGHFDQVVGQDLALLVDEAHHIYPSDGVAGFLSPTMEPATNDNAAGLLAGDFDGVPPDVAVYFEDGLIVLMDGD